MRPRPSRPRLARPFLPAVLLACGASSARAQCPLVQQVFASDASTTALFGQNVALDGDVLVVMKPGGVYAFARQGGPWVEEAMLVPASGSYPSFLGTVAVSGSTALVAHHGAAYVFRRDGPGAWSEEAALVGDDTTSSDYYGVRVDLEGDRAIVSGSLHQHPGAPSRSGAVYVFERTAGVWSQTAELRSGTPVASEQFGAGVALDGGRVAVGTSRIGKAAYLFSYDGSDWTQEARLVPQDPTALFDFSRNLDLDGDTLLVSASYGLQRWPVFRYELQGGVWFDRGELFVGSGKSSILPAVAVLGDRALVGLEQEDDFLGAAHLFQRSQGLWSEVAKLVPIQPDDCDEPSVPPFCAELGASVALSPDTAVSGALFDDFGAMDAGAVYVWGIDDLLPSTVTTRNAGSNPASYTAGHAYTGGSWPLSIDLSTTGHAMALVIGFDSPVELALGGGQTLLCLDLGGNGELFNSGLQVPDASGLVTLDVPVPPSASLVGNALCTQAIHAFGVTPFALSNAQDLVIGGCP